MANSKLENKEFEIPNEMLDLLNLTLNSYNGDTNVKGYKRLVTLTNDKKLSYYAIKRLKNFFDNYNGEKNDTEYLLNGGDKMKNWVNSTLKKARDIVNSETNPYIENPLKKERNTDRTQSAINQLKNIVKENRNSYRFIINESQYKYLLKKYLLK